jgi:hypothetical protein
MMGAAFRFFSMLEANHYIEEMYSVTTAPFLAKPPLLINAGM